MIRLGVPTDLPAASEVFRRASLSNEGDRANLLAHPEHLILGPEGLAEGRTYVAEVDGAVVGFATWSCINDVVELEDLFVDPAWRRRKIAAALVARIVQALQAQGVHRLEVTANPHAMEFYGAAGFTTDGVADTEFGPGNRMSLVISSPASPQLTVESLNNKSRVQQLMTEMSKGRSRSFFAAMADDVIWRWMGVRQWSRNFEGKQAVIDTLFGGSAEALPPSSRILVRAIYGDGDVVVVEHSGHNELPNGDRYDNNYCWVLRFAGGVIKEVREYMDTQLVTETFGTDESSG